jgi:hypothetical protein
MPTALIGISLVSTMVSFRGTIVWELLQRNRRRITLRFDGIEKAARPDQWQYPRFGQAPTGKSSPMPARFSRLVT